MHPRIFKLAGVYQIYRPPAAAAAALENCAWSLIPPKVVFIRQSVVARALIVMIRFGFFLMMGFIATREREIARVYPTRYGVVVYSLAKYCKS